MHGPGVTHDSKFPICNSAFKITPTHPVEELNEGQNDFMFVVLQYNFALCHHALALEERTEKSVNEAMSSYQNASDLVENCYEGGRFKDLLDLAICNNFRHCHFHFVDPSCIEIISSARMECCCNKSSFTTLLGERTSFVSSKMSSTSGPVVSLLPARRGLLGIHFHQVHSPRFFLVTRFSPPIASLFLN